MIREKLIQEELLLRVNPNMPAGMKNRKLRTGDRNYLIVDNILEKDIQPDFIEALFLPWKADTGYYIDLPPNFERNIYFFTAELTGCCVGVQRLESGEIRVCHYNVRGNFDIDDFKRYNNDTANRVWLLPKRYDGKTGDIDCKFYEGYSGGKNPTVFWGEYNVDTKWRFYYQLPTGEICNFFLI